ncbi:putative iron (III) dicitrate transport system permease protein [Gottschalkia acidurici 9a]|uniref:Iron (III) dicitrate transport system permease protein n=1 Tax=Gottschalkia acidurici (strain ATCC 7906 / DSM 604 / BCRC 14475 / CIP 104303 / KCTC 5404 / NCIMB 10678 / 9a) TaxID=1128398 RepID=K0B4J0_GOTA9|nr:iron chelate uptake ABC transporter family permease subunit [Gottschalkia acidurici]AFS79456.1 putative iron (III) dicitrate transport system permease protein [Gottschalkia acidurici 9a]
MIFIKKKKILNLALVISFVILLLLIALSATIGVANVSFLDAIKIMISKVPILNKFLFNNDIDSSHSLIILNLRLPRIILASLIGAGLSIVGATLQGMFKNPMADPYVLGISSGASLGATIAIILGAGYTFFGVGIVTLCAFLGSILTMLFVYSISKVGSKVPVTTILLSGVAINFMLSSIVSIIMVFNRDQVEKIIFWTMGSVSSAGWNQILIIFPIVCLGIFTLMSFSRDLNLMSTGEETAISLGVEVEKTKKILILVCSLLVATCVSFSGIIGFVGLIIPHTVRLIIGSDHRTLLPFSVVGGAIFMVICDTIARSVIPPMEIPVGAITSVLGAPYFIYFLYKNKKKVFG